VEQLQSGKTVIHDLASMKRIQFVEVKAAPSSDRLQVDLWFWRGKSRRASRSVELF
jgi:hypothetical protein